MQNKNGSLRAYGRDYEGDKNIVTVTLEHRGLRLSKMFDAEIVNFLHISGARYADLLFEDMLTKLRIHGDDF